MGRTSTSVGRKTFSRHSEKFTSVWKSLSSRTWDQHLDELEGIIKDASQAAKYVTDTLWDIRQDPHVPEE